MKILSRKMQQLNKPYPHFPGETKNGERTRASKATQVSHYSQKISIGDK